MLTKAQFKFLKAFNKEAKKNKSKNEVLKEYNREKVEVTQMRTLLKKHPKLHPSLPYNEVFDGDILEGAMLINFFEVYLAKVELNKYIEFLDTNNYAITTECQSAMEEYKLKRFSKLKLPIFASVISLLSFILAVAAFAISLCKQ